MFKLQYCTKFDQFILRKLIKIVATRGHIFRLNAPNSISSGAPPQTSLRELTDLLTRWNGIGENGRGGERGEKEGRLRHGFWGDGRP